MNNMKEKLINKIGGRVAVSLGKASINLSEKSFSTCCDFFLYEPKISIELLKANTEKNA